jgi:ABC-type polysaccharide/polyol phosphate transport system ATPase subunit
VKQLEPGRIEAIDLGRKFKITGGGGRTLKGVALRRDESTTHEFWALRHVDLEIAPGETFGVVGRNGSGKSTFLKMLARIYGPSEGRCSVGGRLGSLLELGAGFHPEFNAIENIFLSGSVYGIPRKEIQRDLDNIIGFAELEEFAHQPIKTYSSGMFMRLGFSVAMHVRPDVLLLDEVLAVGDERFVRKCYERLAQYRRDGGTMLLVTHDPNTVKRLCERAMLLEHGEVRMIGRATEVVDEYHDRLSAQDDEADRLQLRVSKNRLFEADVTVLNGLGEPHHEFVEGEAYSVLIHITASEDVNETTVAIGVRDELGREIGSRNVRDIDFTKDSQRTITFNAVDSPIRNGLFLIDVEVSDTATGRVLLKVDAIKTISVYEKSFGSGGPIQIGGTWNVD